ncbi:MAG: hypothetical protein GQ535_01265 [Rhodobacteraceae bacterium]|nr:hypothetical protein [Paracoccaceae bacterium]
MKSPSRRNFLKFGLWSAGAVGTGMASASSGIFNVAKDLILPKQQNITDLLTTFLGPNLPEISVGNYNMARVSEGKSAKPSHYINMSASRLVSALSKAHPEVELRTSADYDSKQYKELTDVVVLGGPISNPDLAHLLGYDLSVEDRLRPGVFLPRADPKKFKLRWEMLHGETTLGEFDGKIRNAIRFENYQEVERARYAIHDRKTGELYYSSVAKGGGRLEQGYLQIVQLQHPLGYRQTFIWGLHGPSLLGFVGDEKELRVGLDMIVSRTEGLGSFQALIPVEVKHEKTERGMVTLAFPDWSKIEIEPLEQLL